MDLGRRRRSWWPCSRSGPSVERRRKSAQELRRSPTPGRGSRARRAASSASFCRSLPCQAERSRASSAHEMVRGAESSVATGAGVAIACDGVRNAAPRCAMRPVDPGLEELEDAGLLPLVLAEGLEVHEERQDLARQAATPSGRTSRRSAATRSTSRLREPERDVVGEPVVAQQQRQAAGVAGRGRRDGASARPAAARCRRRARRGSRAPRATRPGRRSRSARCCGRRGAPARAPRAERARCSVDLRRELRGEASHASEWCEVSARNSTRPVRGEPRGRRPAPRAPRLASCSSRQPESENATAKRGWRASSRSSSAVAGQVAPLGDARAGASAFAASSK